MEKNLFNLFGMQTNENVISNLLEYFFRESSLKEEFTKAFCELIEIKDLRNIKESDRESNTDNCKRVDLVLIFENYVIGIENKIEANDFNNPYEDYKKYLEKIAKDNNIKDINTRLVLLSLNQDESYSEQKEALTDVIKYNKLLDGVKKNIKFKKIDDFDKTLFNDFCENIKNIEKPSKYFKTIQNKIWEKIKQNKKYSNIDGYINNICLYENSSFFNKSQKTKVGSNYIVFVIYDKSLFNFNENDIMFIEKDKIGLNFGIENKIEISLNNENEEKFVNEAAEIGEKLIDEFDKFLENIKKTK